MNATVNLVVGISAWAAMGFPVPLPAASKAPPGSTTQAVVFEADCAVIKCKGDFPVSSNRKYAESIMPTTASALTAKEPRNQAAACRLA